VQIRFDSFRLQYAKDEWIRVLKVNIIVNQKRASKGRIKNLCCDWTCRA
jgi:hypothetical protein